ncbi:MAG: LptF/LptG family permease [Elusimicrobia bacterium]|nr:LptF/LptG family permease [Elusimicrobiota bacterium]
MPILPRYVLRQFLPTFGAGLVLFFSVLLMNQFLRLFTLAVMKGLPLAWILACFARLLPSFASLTVPMAYLVATMITLGALTDSGEVMALRSAGFAYDEIVRPFFWTAVALSALLLAVNHKIGPDGFHSFRERTTEAGQKMAKIELRSRAFTPVGPWRLYAREADASSGRLEGVYLVKPGGNEPVRVNAERGSLNLLAGRGVEMELEGGQLQLPNADPERYTSGRFERYRVFMPLEGQAAPREPDLQELTTSDLTRRIAQPGVPRERRLEYIVEKASRSAGALSPFVFFWIAAPLGVGLKKRTRGLDFAASLGVMFAYYGLLVVGVSLGRRHENLATWAPWLGDVVGLALGAWLTKRAAAQ